MDKWTKFEITPISEFERIAKENEYFFWHFVSKENLGLTVVPLGADFGRGNSLEVMRQMLGVTIFQSFTEDSIDFLVNLGLPSIKIKHDKSFVPSFFGFKRRRMVDSTINRCYCEGGITDVIYNTNSKYFESFLSVEEKDLE